MNKKPRDEHANQATHFEDAQLDDSGPPTSADQGEHPADLPERESGEVTLQEAAALAGLSETEMRKLQRHRGLIPVRKVRGPRNGTLVVRVSDLERSGLLKPDPVPIPTVVIAGVLVEQRVDAVWLWQAAFVFEVTVTDFKERYREVATTPEDESRIPVSSLASHPEVLGDPIKSLFVIRLAEDTLALDEPESDDAKPESHNVALRRLR